MRPLSRYKKTIPTAFLVGAVAAVFAVDAWWLGLISVAAFACAISEATDRRIVIAAQEGRVTY